MRDPFITVHFVQMILAAAGSPFPCCLSVDHWFVLFYTATTWLQYNPILPSSGYMVPLPSSPHTQLTWFCNNREWGFTSLSSAAVGLYCEHTVGVAYLCMCTALICWFEEEQSCRERESDLQPEVMTINVWNRILYFNDYLLISVV